MIPHKQDALDLESPLRQAQEQNEAAAVSLVPRPPCQGLSLAVATKAGCGGLGMRLAAVATMMTTMPATIAYLMMVLTMSSWMDSQVSSVLIPISLRMYCHSATRPLQRERIMSMQHMKEDPHSHAFSNCLHVEYLLCNRGIDKFVRLGGGGRGCC